MNLPKPLSPGEELLALHLRAEGIKFEREVQLISGRRWIYDFVLPEFRIAIEVNGQIWHKGGHTTGQGIERDFEKNNAAVLAGYFVFWFSTGQVESGQAIQTIREAIGGSG